MLKSLQVHWCGDPSDQIFVPRMNHTVGWSPRPTCERLRWDHSILGHPLLMLRMKCWPLKCFLLTTRWELQGAAPHPASANKLTLGQVNYHVHFTLVFMTVSPNLTWTLPCINLWHDKRYSLNSSASFAIIYQHHLDRKTQPCLFLSGCHSKVSGFSIQCGFSLLTWHTVDLRQMKCPQALTKTCIVKKVGQEIFMIECNLWDLTQRMKVDEERAETGLWMDGRAAQYR